MHKSLSLVMFPRDRTNQSILEAKQYGGNVLGRNSELLKNCKATMPQCRLGHQSPSRSKRHEKTSFVSHSDLCSMMVKESLVIELEVRVCLSTTRCSYASTFIPSQLNPCVSSSTSPQSKAQPLLDAQSTAVLTNFSPSDSNRIADYYVSSLRDDIPSTGTALLAKRDLTVANGG